MSLTRLILFLTSALFISACSKTTIGGTEEGVIIKKPWFVGYEGVVDTPVETGTAWHAISTTIIPISMTPFQRQETFTDLISKDRKPVDIDVYVQLQVKDNHTPALYKNFGMQAYKHNVSKPFRSAFREIAKQYTMWELIEDASVMRTIEAKARERLTAILERKGIHFDVLGVEVSKANPPDEVKAEVARTAAQTQRAETEAAREQAELIRLAAEQARAKADRAYQDEMKLTADQYIRLMQIDAQYKMIDMVKNKDERLTLLIGVDGVAVPTK